MDVQQLKRKASAWLGIYVKCLEERPILTKAITRYAVFNFCVIRRGLHSLHSGVVASLGNLISQLILKLKYSRLFIHHTISWRSVAAFGVFGYVLCAPHWTQNTSEDNWSQGMCPTTVITCLMDLMWKEVVDCAICPFMALVILGSDDQHGLLSF